MRIFTPVLSRIRWPGSAAAVGALGSVLLHLLIFEAILLGSGGHPPSHKDGLGATALSSDNTPLGVLILVDASSESVHQSDPIDQLGSLGHLLQSPLLTIASPHVTFGNFDFLDESKRDPSAASDTTGDQRGQAALFGLYMRQVQARIERAWRHPQGTPPNDSFDCRVQISQSKRGDVRELQLIDCTDDLPWQLSLVDAIDAASPLPAPPDPRVFADLLRLSFHAAATQAGASAPPTLPHAGLLPTSGSPQPSELNDSSSPAGFGKRPPTSQGQRQ